MKNNMLEIAGQLIKRAGASGGDELLESAAVLLAHFAESGADYVVRKDYDGENLGVICTHPGMIGAVVRVYDTGARVPA